MFSFIKKNQSGTKITFTVDGMHCMSCSMNIDGSLEDSEGVLESTTNYAQGKTEVQYDAKKITPQEMQHIIEELGYTATVAQ